MAVGVFEEVTEAEGVRVAVAGRVGVAGGHEVGEGPFEPLRLRQQLLLLDEAFNGLDASSVETTRQLLRDLNAEGRTIVITSHQQEDIDTLCASVWRINHHTLEPVTPS